MYHKLSTNLLLFSWATAFFLSIVMAFPLALGLPLLWLLLLLLVDTTSTSSSRLTIGLWPTTAAAAAMADQWANAAATEYSTWVSRLCQVVAVRMMVVVITILILLLLLIIIPVRSERVWPFGAVGEVVVVVVVVEIVVAPKSNKRALIY